MIADQNFYDTCFTIFYPTASATAKDENCAWFCHKKELAQNILGPLEEVIPNSILHNQSHAVALKPRFFYRTKYFGSK